MRNENEVATRRDALALAIELHTYNKKFDPDKVLVSARKFERFLLATETDKIIEEAKAAIRPRKKRHQKHKKRGNIF